MPGKERQPGDDGDPSDVLLLSAEDDYRATVRPRLEASAKSLNRAGLQEALAKLRKGDEVSRCPRPHHDTTAPALNHVSDHRQAAQKTLFSMDLRLWRVGFFVQPNNAVTKTTPRGSNLYCQPA